MYSLIFIHQNFPGQFIHLLRHLAQRSDCRLYGIGDAENVRTASSGNLTVLTYKRKKKAITSQHPYVRFFEQGVLYGQEVAKILIGLQCDGVKPHLIMVHPSWGEGMFIRDIFPTTPIVTYNEYYDPEPDPVQHFDPEFPNNIDKIFQARARNGVHLVAQQHADAGISATYWQRNFFPTFVQAKTRVIFDGIDTQKIMPKKGVMRLEMEGLQLSSEDEVITYLSRNFEPHRGFHRFMRCLPAIQKARPQAHVLIVGDDKVSYSEKPPHHPHWRAALLAEVGGQLDMKRIHFFPKLPYDQYIAFLQLSQVHIYLTYPSVLSWSMMEALAAGCLVIGARVPPVQEIIEDGVNGLLVDFFDSEALVAAVNRVFDDPTRMAAIRHAARNTIVQRYDLHTMCLPQQLQFLEQWLPGLAT